MKSTISTRPVIVGLGELLWDLFPNARKLGGAPANFACHAHCLGADSRVVSAVGDDELGREATQQLKDFGLDVSCIATIRGKATGTVPIAMHGGSHTFEIITDVAWDYLSWSDGLQEVACNADAVCFGTLACRSPKTAEMINRFLQTCRPQSLRILDVNLRAPFYSHEAIRKGLAQANVLKLNEDELPIVAEACGIAGRCEQVLSDIARVWQLNAIALTRGSGGSVILKGDEYDEHIGPAVKVVDSVGAGDSFTAALAIGLLGEMPIHQINHWAASVAAYVCTQAGATPQLPRKFRRQC